MKYMMFPSMGHELQKTNKHFNYISNAKKHITTSYHLDIQYVVDDLNGSN